MRPKTEWFRLAFSVQFHPFSIYLFEWIGFGELQLTSPYPSLVRRGDKLRLLTRAAMMQTATPINPSACSRAARKGDYGWPKACGSFDLRGEWKSFVRMQNAIAHHQHNGYADTFSDSQSPQERLHVHPHRGERSANRLGDFRVRMTKANQPRDSRLPMRHRQRNRERFPLGSGE